MKNIDKLSLSSKGLRYKLKIAFSLMSVLPLLVCIYLISQYLLPLVGLKIDIAASIIISIFIAFIGFFVIKEVFDRVLSMTSEVKRIAAGDFQHNLDIIREDEVGELGDSLNRLTQRIRSNMEELKDYSERTAEINLGIQKRVIVLSGLLQISSFISQSAKLEEIFKAVVEKSRLLADSDMAYLFFREDKQETFSMRCVDGLGFQDIIELKIEPTEDIFYKINNINTALVLDKHNLLANDLSVFIHKKLRLQNTLALPVHLRGRVIAVIGIGNARESFAYNKEDIELLDVFAKQLAIAAENDKLNHSIRKLETIDPLTGLYNDAFMRERLKEEIKRAIMYQRPCAFILFDVDNFEQYAQKFGSIYTEATLKRISVLIHDSVNEVDRVGRIGDDEFALILPEKNKRQAMGVAENIRKKIEFSFSEKEDAIARITVSAGVSENPIDGISADELIIKAKEMLNLAKAQGRNRIVIRKEQ